MRSTVGALVHSNEPPVGCRVCAGPMRVEKTFPHHGVTLELGHFVVRETTYVCAQGCTQQGAKVRHRSPELAQRLPPRGTVGYDVIAYVGLQRFVEFRQREEIRSSLYNQYGIVLSSGEISLCAKNFLLYIEALHHEHAPALRAQLSTDGGWPMHVDATGEDGQGTLLVVYAGWRRWVLGAWKIPTERADAILPRLQETEKLFGAPCSIMRDLGRAVIEATEKFAHDLNKDIPILACHTHFLRDVGKDLLKAEHDTLRELFRRFAVQKNLRGLVRELGHKLGKGITTARQDLNEWLGTDLTGYALPEGQAGMAFVRQMAVWTLDYAADASDDGFPFDLPYLDFYRRCLEVCRAAEAFLCVPDDNRQAYKALERLHRIVEPLRSEVPFQSPVNILETRQAHFNELREALRLKPKVKRDPPASAPLVTPAELRDIEAAVKKLISSLRKRRPERGPAKAKRDGIDIILEHIDRHGDHLWGHSIRLPNAGGGIRLVDRTNNLLEGFFRGGKQGERRRSGRKKLTQDLEQLPAGAALAANLNKPDYVEIVCGTLDDLPRAFARLDAKDPRKALPARVRGESNLGDNDVVSSSTSTNDRKFVRTDAMKNRIRRAARRRAPRLAPRRRVGRSSPRIQP